MIVWISRKSAQRGNFLFFADSKEANTFCRWVACWVHPHCVPPINTSIEEKPMETHRSVSSTIECVPPVSPDNQQTIESTTDESIPAAVDTIVVPGIVALEQVNHDTTPFERPAAYIKSAHEPAKEIYDANPEDVEYLVPARTGISCEPECVGCCAGGAEEQI